MRIDVILEPDKSAEEVVELGQLAENLGFGAVWMPNKLDGKDPFASFAILAQATSKIKMGPIAISPFELHPIKMATSLLTLNEISKGRAIIVVGGGGGTIQAMGITPQKCGACPRRGRTSALIQDARRTTGSTTGRSSRKRRCWRSA